MPLPGLRMTLAGDWLPPQASASFLMGVLNNNMIQENSLCSFYLFIIIILNSLVL